MGVDGLLNDTRRLLMASGGGDEIVYMRSGSSCEQLYSHAANFDSTGTLPIHVTPLVLPDLNVGILRLDHGVGAHLPISGS